MRDVCGKCAEKIQFCGDGLCCEKCGKPIVSFGEKQLCYFCVNGKSKYFDRIASVFEYESLVRESVIRYKTYGLGKYATLYAEVMAARLYEEYGDMEFDCICATPSHKNRKRIRGFDGVDEICKRLSRLTGIRYMPGVIRKVRQTEKQSSLNYEKRMKNLLDSMDVRKGVELDGKRVLLVDDVCTTRATIMECAKVLKKNGAKRVYALTFATAVKNN